MTAPQTPRVAIPPQRADREHSWLRDVLALDLRATLGRAAWRPQVLCLAVHAYADDAEHDPSAWPTVDELAADLDWQPGLVRRHLELAHAARLLELVDGPSGPADALDEPALLADITVGVANAQPPTGLDHVRPMRAEQIA